MRRLSTIIVFFISLYSWNADAESARQLLSEAVNGIIAQSQNGDLAGKIALLRERAKASGQLRVIIGLKVPFAPEGQLSAQTVLQQKSEIQYAVGVLRNKLIAARLKNSASIRAFQSVPFIATTVTPAELEILLQQPEIISIEADHELAALLTESVPVIGAPTAWTAGYTGSGLAVAVLDTGVDKAHPFLTGKVISEACYSGGGVAANSFCPGNALSSTASGAGVNCPINYTECDHGTHVAGIIAGTSVGMSGVAKGANLISIQVFSKYGSGTTSYSSDIISALQRVYDLRNTFRIASVNISIGAGQFLTNCDTYSPAFRAAIDNLRSVNIATVIASGNGGYTSSLAFPACISTAISVGSTGDASGNSRYFSSVPCTDVSAVDKVSCFSNTSGFLKLLAPGAYINSSVPGGGYAVKAGTSMAAPHVAGAWAVIAQASPNISVTNALNAFVNTGTLVTDYRTPITKPRINLAAAVNLVASVASIGAASYSVSEGAGNMTIPVTRTNPTFAATVDYMTADGTARAGSDYTAKSGTLSFAAGVATANIVVPITNDTSVESSETFTVSLSNPTGLTLGSPNSTTVTIIDNDALPSVKFGASTYSVGEGAGSVTIPVTRSSTSGTASVKYATANGTAIAGSDYSAKSGTLSFAAGVATVNIVVSITNDTAVESNETFSVSLNTPSGLTLGSPNSTVVTIVDNDTLTVIRKRSFAF